MLKRFWNWVFDHSPLWERFAQDTKHYNAVLHSTRTQLTKGIKVYSCWPESLCHSEEVLVIYERGEGVQEIVWVERRSLCDSRDDCITRAVRNAAKQEAARRRRGIEQDWPVSTPI